MKRILSIIILVLLLGNVSVRAEISMDDSVFISLRNKMGEAFNAADSVQFSRAIIELEKYCLSKNDLHAYYTQRCNEIVFLLNREDIFGAYKKSLKLSRELRERNLTREIYMAINMMGHIYHYCGNNEMARRCFNETLEIMEKEGYTEGMPPIYMNLVQVEIEENPKEALRLIDLAAKYCTTDSRLIDVEAYRAIYYFKQKDMPSFRKAYNTYKKLEKKGLTSVHGSSLEIYNYLTQNKVDSAFALAAENYDRFGHEAAIYEWIGDWENAYSIMKKDMAETDSINAVILSNSMEGIQNELDLFEYEQKLARQRIIILTGLVCILVLVIITMVVYNVIRRRNIRRLEEARDRALESDRMKSAFINNVSHEIRTPLNIISGFSQVMATSHNEMEDAERMRLVRLIYKNTELIVSLVDEMLDLSMAESSNSLECKDLVVINEMCHSVLEKYADRKNDNVEILFTSNVDDEYKILSHKYILPKVINALVDNAVKYTDEGTVSLKVQLLQKSIVFVVEDTGRGIPAAEAERIFDRFEKLDTFMSGLGLGLTLARALAARLDGTITLDTTYNEGARFQVEFPLK